ncbi:MAG TPA: hypothetical protein VNM22_11940 [Candidatus Limnocylindrales bacterium]|nr:hypothetical protein [Candidatus Limnocylindrales bacterium]
MICPKCRFEQSDQYTECLRCGVIFTKFKTSSKVQDPSRQPVYLPKKEAQKEFEPQRIEEEGWKALGIGLIFAGIILFFPFPTFVLSHFIILVHELGHALAAWLFGYPSIPAFDFNYGGGVAIQLQEKPVTWILFVIYALLGYLLYFYRKNLLTLTFLLTSLLFYTFSLFTSFHEILILFMGHGTELIFAGIFLYRALSGFACMTPVERPLYAFTGFFTVFYDIRFSYRLWTDPDYRTEYAEAKGGGDWMDFSRMAKDYLPIDLSTMALFFFLLCFLPPLLSFIIFRYQAYISSFMLRFLQRESGGNH